jgi:hypothetical protein
MTTTTTAAPRRAAPAWEQSRARYPDEKGDVERAGVRVFWERYGDGDPAACDLAVVQGGLTTAMELAANKRPFLFFPLRHHFEQHFHVRHRLDRYGAGRRMDFETATPEVIAEAIAAEIGRKVDYRDVESDGARCAAARLAEMIY